MKFNESKLLILLASIIFGFLVASQISFGKLIPKEVVTLQNYQQMTSEIRKLSDEISILNEKKRNLDLKVSEYKNTGQSVSQKTDKIVEDLNDVEFYLGLTDVEGPGIIISVDDSPLFGMNSYIEGSELMLLTHDSDLLRLVWELKNAGAEAISINDQRILYNSDFYCGGPVIFVNNLELVPPYIIKAVGDPETLSHVLKKDDSYYSELEDRTLEISFRKYDSIKILKYDRNLNYTELKTVKE